MSDTIPGMAEPSTHSPRIAVRVPRDLHDRLTTAAARENRTVSNLVVHLLAQALPDDGQGDLFEVEAQAS